METCRDIHIHYGADLRLRGVSHRKTVTIDIHTADFQPRVVVIYDCLHIVFPSPVSNGSKCAQLQPIRKAVKHLGLDTVMESIKPCHHVPGIISILLLVWVGHH